MRDDWELDIRNNFKSYCRLRYIALAIIACLTNGLSSAAENANSYIHDIPIRVVGKNKNWNDSANAVHPSIVRWKDRNWLAYTPLPIGRGSGGARSENPHLAVSIDGQKWGIHINESSSDTILNPLFGREVMEGADHLSDPDLFTLGDSILGIVFRVSVCDPDSTHLYLSFTRNGIDWTSPKRILSSSNKGSLLSPAILNYEQTKLRMWVIHDEHFINEIQIFESSDREFRKWISVPLTKQPMPPPAGKFWHLDVISRNQDLLFLLTITQRGSGLLSYLYAGKSYDGGLTITVDDKPLLTPSENGWDNGMIYRSTGLVIDDSTVEIFYSGKAKGPNGAWHTSHVTAVIP